MTVLQALVLGIVQGLGEFLPISSSGHLVLLQKLFGIEEGAMSFAIFVHLGTLVSLCVVMRERLLKYIREPLGHIPKMVVLGTIPTVVLVLLFEGLLSDLFDTGASLGVGFIFTALLLYFAESHGKSENDFVRALRHRNAGPRQSDASGGGGGGGRLPLMGPAYGMNERRRADTDKRVTPMGALIVGVAQGIATVPAVSRSGSTIAAGIMCDFGRPAAIEFAFLMSIPVTLMAVAYDLLKMVLGRGGEAVAAAAATAAAAAPDAAAEVGAAMSAAGPLVMAVGFLAAAISGYFAARFMLRAIQKIKLTWFSLYVGLLGVLILVDQLFIGAVFDKLF
ncbi:MAG: undecaprenyl-diphosphate phosphatase [Oscillospiraceae bacterium]|nr:undecaprenyl-diphosphate phosphatase [Oscillospiraceae bacterium]